MFTGEFAVTAREHDGRQFSLFASAEDVRIQNQPNGSPVPGSLRVTEIETKNDLVLVVLPQPILGGGSWITVKTDQIDSQTRK